MRNRIWYKLVDYVYFSSYLSEFIKTKKRNSKIVNAILIILALVSISGWFKFAEGKIFWASVLVFIQAIRILRPQIMISEKELFAISNSQGFYQQNAIELEEIWHKYNSGDITDKYAMRVLSKISKDESVMMKLNKHDKIKQNKRIDAVALNDTNDYIFRITK